MGALAELFLVKGGGSQEFRLFLTTTQRLARNRRAVPRHGRNKVAVVMTWLLEKGRS